MVGEACVEFEFAAVVVAGEVGAFDDDDVGVGSEGRVGFEGASVDFFGAAGCDEFVGFVAGEAHAGVFAGEAVVGAEVLERGVVFGGVGFGDGAEEADAGGATVQEFGDSDGDDGFGCAGSGGGDIQAAGHEVLAWVVGGVRSLFSHQF